MFFTSAVCDVAQFSFWQLCEVVAPNPKHHWLLPALESLSACSVASSHASTSMQQGKHRLWGVGSCTLDNGCPCCTLVHKGAKGHMSVMSKGHRQQLKGKQRLLIGKMQKQRPAVSHAFGCEQGYYIAYRGGPTRVIYTRIR